jgi:LPXTG-motif cell wall-anchored protein
MQQTIDLIIKVADPTSSTLPTTTLPTTGDTALVAAGIALVVALAAAGIFALKNRWGGGPFQSCR